MNKKNITINTDFYDQGNEAKLIESTQSNLEVVDGNEVDSRVDQYQNNQNFSVENSFNNYQHQNAHENNYSHEQGHQDGSMETLTLKLHSANEMQNILSRTQTRLFIMWWEELISKLHQMYYSSQEYKSIQQAQKQQIMQDYNHVFNNHIQQDYSNHNNDEIKQNVFANRQNQEYSVENRKKQLIQRHKKGITLDSLQKLKSQRSRSGAHHQIFKEVGSSGFKPNQDSKETFLNEQAEENSVSGASRKSYRQKFLQYKHKSKSKEPGMPKSQTYKKFVSYHPHATSGDQANSLNRTYRTNNIRNVQSATNIQQSKNDILRNINHLLMDREDIYQGEDYRYYINHRDSSKNIYNFDTHSYQNYPGSSYSRPVKITYNQQTEMQSTQAQDDELVRARLIDEIVEKLKYSKIRLEEVHKKQPKQDELQVIKKLNRLEKVIMEIKNENQIKPEVRQIKEHREPETKKYNRSSEEELYRKFVEEIATIKAEINLIKTLRQYAPTQITQPQPQSIIVDNQSSHIIAEQQKMLANYQREYERLLQERSKVVVQERTSVGVFPPKEPEPVLAVQQNNNGEQSLLGQLIEKGKNTTKKVGWDDGWDLKEQKKEFHANTNVNTFSNQANLSHSVYRNPNPVQENRQNYRYTRRQVLESIGMKGQLQEQKKVWRERQARDQLDKERREVEIREMTEKVNWIKKSESQKDGVQDVKTMRQKQEQNWQKYQRQRIDVDQDVNRNIFCQLFPCK